MTKIIRQLDVNEGNLILTWNSSTIVLGIYMGKKESGMIVVRFVFQAKFGKAEEVVNGFKEGAEMTAREVLDYCRLELEPYTIPSRVRFVREFPRSTTSKPQKFKLREMALREAEEGRPS